MKLKLFKKRNSNEAKANLVIEKQGRTKEQRAVIDYFADPAAKGGCLGRLKRISDTEFVNILNARIDKYSVEARALEVLGLDQSQVSEVEPIDLRGYDFDGVDGNAPAAFRKCKDGNWRSSAYQITRIYFGDKQIYFYELNFDLRNNKVWENTKEFFYKDIVSLRTSLKTSEIRVRGKKGCFRKLGKLEYITHDYRVLNLNVVGDGVKAVMPSTEKRTQIFQALKAKIRDAKAA